MTPWDVKGSITTDGKQQGIDYEKLIDQFGTRRVDAALLERFEKLTGREPHIFLRRGMFFSHRYATKSPWHIVTYTSYSVNLTKFSIVTNRESHSFSTLAVGQVVIACTLDT